MNTALLIAFIVFLLGSGIVLIAFPRSIQRLASRAVNQGLTARSHRLRSFISSAGYLWNLRLVGSLALLIGGLLVLGLAVR